MRDAEMELERMSKDEHKDHQQEQGQEEEEGSAAGRLDNGQRAKGGGGQERLAAFAKLGASELGALLDWVNQTVGCCRALGVFFGEGSDEAKSAHILGTLVTFLDLLEAAKKVERVF
ncbi:unnamed protein product [Discosporangium mesarthrocarpum]